MNKYWFILVFLLFTCNCNSQTHTAPQQIKERNELVRVYIEGQGVKDKRVIAAMKKVERHRFVPNNLLPYAYYDQPLPIGEGQTISQPSLVAFMTELLELKQSDKVLEIGTGSGYQAAILGELVDSVFTIEIIKPLGVKAEKLINNLGYSNILLRLTMATKDGQNMRLTMLLLLLAPPRRIFQILCNNSLPKMDGW